MIFSPGEDRPEESGGVVGLRKVCRLIEYVTYGQGAEKDIYPSRRARSDASKPSGDVNANANPSTTHITTHPIPYIARSTLPLIWYQSARRSANW